MSTVTKFLSDQISTSSRVSSNALIGLVAGISFLLSAGLTKYFNHSDLIKSQDQAQIEDEQKYISSIEQQIFSLPIVKELKNDSAYIESRAYEHIKEERLECHFTAGTLSGKGKLAVRPLIFSSREKNECIVICHVGNHLCGHDGIVHGGLLSTIMDELLARTVIPCLPDKNGATAYLNVNFRKPCKTDQILIGRSNVTKLERRKGFVEGSLETLEGVKVVDANALFISLKKLQ